MTVDVDPAILAELAMVPDRSTRPRVEWSARQDALLLAGWPTKNQEALAKLIGRHVGTCRRRYRELAEAKR